MKGKYMTEAIKKVKNNIENYTKQPHKKVDLSTDGIIKSVNEVEIIPFSSYDPTQTYNFEEIINTMAKAQESDGNAIKDLKGSEYKSFEDFEKHIKENIIKAGYGTPEAVVAAAISLLYDYTKATGKNVKYSMGHRDSVELLPGMDGLRTSEDLCCDCSGFAGWCIYNAGYNLPIDPLEFCTYTIKQWAETTKIAKKGTDGLGKPGDLLVKNNNEYGHVMLIVGANEEGYIIAENSGLDGIEQLKSSTQDGGIIRIIPFDSEELDSYIRVDMTDYYNDPNNKRKITSPDKEKKDTIVKTTK